MKQLVSVCVNGHLIWRRRNIPALKYALSQCRNHFTLVKTIGEPHNDLPKKPVLIPKKSDYIQFLKRFSTNFQKENILMDFEVWQYPTLFVAIKNLYYILFRIRKIDESFSLTEFFENANIALRVVITLISEFRFSELEGLVTPECKKEIEENIKRWPRNQVAALAYKPEQVCLTAAGETLVFSDENDAEKLFVEIRVIHYVFFKLPTSEHSEFPTGIFDLLRSSRADNTFLCGVFNSRFIKEYTEGILPQGQKKNKYQVNAQIFGTLCTYAPEGMVSILADCTVWWLRCFILNIPHDHRHLGVQIVNAGLSQYHVSMNGLTFHSDDQEFEEDFLELPYPFR